MADSDPFNSALSGVDSVKSIGHLSHEIQPTFNITDSVLEIFCNRGYINGFEFVDDDKVGLFEAELKGAINNCGAVKPRYSVGTDDFEKWKKRLLPACDYGALTVTTNYGVMSHYKVREKDIGGQIIAHVY